MKIDDNHPQLELVMDIPSQRGLSLDIHLNLQNEDELHLSVGSFWNSWFPCTKTEIVELYIDAITGLISGRFRILEHLRGKRAVRAELQVFESGHWETVSNWSTWALPWPQKSFSVIKNESAAC